MSGEVIRFRNPVKSLGYAQLQHAATLDPELSDGAYRTYALYLMYAQQDDNCWPGRRTMAQRRGKDDATITRHNQELEALGYITRERVFGRSSVTWIEDLEDNERLRGLSEQMLEQRKNAPTNGAKMRRQLAQKCAAEEEPIERTKEEEPLTRPPLIEEDYTVRVYYKDKRVSCKGKATTGPWSIPCEVCNTEVKIDNLDTPYPCHCGMREYILEKVKPPAKRKHKHEAVEAYFLITGLKSTEWEEDIVGTVTDIARWRRVVKEYIKQGWSPKSVGTMLKYYEENRMPGTKKEGEPAANDYGPDPMLMNMPGG